jgi:hypothetical protein
MLRRQTITSTIAPAPSRRQSKEHAKQPGHRSQQSKQKPYAQIHARSAFHVTIGLALSTGPVPPGRADQAHNDGGCFPGDALDPHHRAADAPRAAAKTAATRYEQISFACCLFRVDPCRVGARGTLSRFAYGRANRWTRSTRTLEAEARSRQALLIVSLSLFLRFQAGIFFGRPASVAPGPIPATGRAD